MKIFIKRIILSLALVSVFSFQVLQARPNITNDPTDPNDWCNINQEALANATSEKEKARLKKSLRRFCGILPDK